MKKTFTVLMATILSINVICQVNWTKHPEPVMSPGESGSWESDFIMAGCVLNINDTLKMWYSGFTDPNRGAVGYAYSTDGGMTWTKYTGNPVLKRGSDGSFDELRVYSCEVLLDESGYHMWYLGANNDNIENMGYATSPDGINWTKYAGNPIESVGPGSVMKIGNKMHMWTNYFIAPNLLKIAYSTSENGYTWTEYPDSPILNAGSSSDWDYPRVQDACVLNLNNTFQMYYSGGDFFAWQVGYATSTDGVNWTKDPMNPVLKKGAAGSWDSEFIFAGSVLFDADNQNYLMWYTGGTKMFGGSIGFASSSISTAVHANHLQEGFRIYPNPSGDIITLETGIKSHHIVRITSLTGQVVWEQHLDNKRKDINVSALPQGIYFVTISTDSAYRTQRFFKN